MDYEARRTRTVIEMEEELLRLVFAVAGSLVPEHSLKDACVANGDLRYKNKDF